MSHSPSYMSHSALAEQPHSWVLPQVGWVLGQLALLEPRSAQPGDKVEIAIQKWKLSLTSYTLPLVTVGTVVLCVRGRHVAHPIIVATLSIRCAAVLWVGACPVKITEPFRAFGAVSVFTAF